MKTFEGRGLTADQIALYQRLEAQRYPKLHPLVKGVMVFCSAPIVLAPVVAVGVAAVTLASPFFVLKLAPVMAWYWLSPFALIAGPVVLLQAMGDQPKTRG